ncbi:MAG: methyltransferase, partial [Rhodoferax sp.]|nr:methyltransferase [Rhodoferax sp.]
MSTHWTNGYVAEVAYPHTYVAELNPQRLHLPFLRAGLAVPEVLTACELGFGQGLSVNIHAAASGVRWHGNDFNPDQALNARGLAAASGAGAALTDEAFADFCARDDLPNFDFIGLHGVWSWISDDNRAHIVDFIRRKLNVGGVVYLGYNTQPGWAATVPLRELMTQYVQRIAPPGQGLGSRIDAALLFVEQLLATDPEFARVNPTMAPLVASLKGQDTHYLAHEFFNSSWRPMSFAEMADALMPAKLSYACSAHHGVDWLDLSPAQQSLLAGIADPVLRESVRDFCVNQQFRKDYWVKGARRLNPVAHDQALRALRVVLLTPAHDMARSVVTS